MVYLAILSVSIFLTNSRGRDIHFYRKTAAVVVVKSPVKRKRAAKKTKVVVDTLLYCKKKSAEHKTSQSNPIWPNITTIKSPKPQLRAR